MILHRDQTFNYVCCICGYNANREELGEAPIGTGTFISKDNKYYILTANHVVVSPIKVEFIYLCDNKMNPTKIDIKKLNNRGRWVSHPVADMAIFEIDSMANPWISTRSFPYDHCEISMVNLTRDTELTTVGFPLGLGIQNIFAPLTFRSFPASSILKIQRIDKPQNVLDFFLLEDPSIGGYSGGPVFDLAYKVDYNMTQTKDKTRLYGIMHGYCGGNAGGSMSCVTPISYLKDLI